MTVARCGVDVGGAAATGVAEMGAGRVLAAGRVVGAVGGRVDAGGGVVGVGAAGGGLVGWLGRFWWA